MRRPAAFCLVFFVCSAALAQNTSALINEQLDKLVKLKIDAPLPQAMQQIGADTGVPIHASQAVWDLLPWGEQTKITATIENQTLRGALQAITRKLGLTFELGDQAVELRPLPALQRLGRRATVEELQVLDLLARTPYEPAATSAPAPATGTPAAAGAGGGAGAGAGASVSVRQVLATVDARLESANSPFAIENRAFNGESAPAIGIARNATLLDALEAIHKKTDATWYPWGKTLVIVPKTDQVRNQLAKTISARFNGVDVGQVLTELFTRAGVNYTIEPGALQRIAPEARTIRLTLDNATIQQALESIAGFTGLAYSVTENGVAISNPTTGAAASAGGAAREPTVGLLTLDNGMQVVVRESQVPPDMREYLKEKTDRQLAKIRQMMKEEGFKPKPPATQPATAPAPTKNEDL
jgi:hypothetical protein